ncbi:MAG: CZB domain-containing protein [Alphaproteobacteria bacterium]|nr:CZB domain-containing protein [Alphaproteobacteria bacterium]
MTSEDATSGTAQTNGSLFNEIKAAIEHIAAGHYSKVSCSDPTYDDMLQDIRDKLMKAEEEDLRRAVGLSISINDAVTAGAEMARGAQEINEKSNGMAATVQELTTSVENIYSNTETVAQETDEMLAIAQRGMQSTANAVKTMEDVHRVTGETVTKIESLADATRQISAVLGFISDIADQTNLLALNATIEAARAGEAGKGFAVVAGEVKQLATKTNESAKDIRGKIKFLTNQTNAINEMMQRVPEIVEQGQNTLNNTREEMGNISSLASVITGKIRNVADILSEQKAATNEVAEGAVKISELADNNLRELDATLDAMDTAEKLLLQQTQYFTSRDVPNLTIHLAKSDHVIWKKRLANMLVGRETLNPDELSNHHSCRLGKWYYAIGREDFGKHPAYSSLEPPHERVHKHGIAAARRYAAGDLAGAIEEVKIVTQESKEVLKYLDELLK